jgi:hypothetical protein
LSTQEVLSLMEIVTIKIKEQSKKVSKAIPVTGREGP